MRSVGRALIVGALFIALAGCESTPVSAPTIEAPTTSAKRTTTTAAPAPTTTTTAAPTTTTTAAAVLTVTRVVDGDTVDVSTGETVRLIGIDTPESGACGYREATDRLVALVGGQPVMLEPGARDDIDKYGRLLRYVLVDGVESGGVLVAEGLAAPRYNSTDGYGAHRREAEYAAEARPSTVCTPATTVARATTVPATAKPTVKTTVPKTTAPPADYYANCSAARAAGAAPLYRGEPGYRSALDRDNDEVACE
jgi:endonuclease YncB( thermonuclease family)